jgi:hypothetical protein
MQMLQGLGSSSRIHSYCRYAAFISVAAQGDFSWLLRRLAAALQTGNSHFGAEPARVLLRLQIFAAGC